MKTYILLIFTLLIVGCGQRRTTVSTTAIIDSIKSGTTDDAIAIKKITPHQAYNSIYHWKTSYNPTESELAFLQAHQIKRLYIRFFDVALDNHWLEGQLSVVPIATTTFPQVPPSNMEVVPTIYITLEAIRSINGKEADYADRIVTRILAMATRHNIENINEVQFDCDWTKTTRNSYFELCRIAKDSLHKKGIELSSTIRLHQLGDDCPPINRGVLMLYNTGALKSAQTKNSILNYSHVAPYMKNANYRMHLDFAYPTFAWGIWFRNNKFKAILRTTDFSDRDYYQQRTDGTYKVLKDHFLESHELLRGDIIRLENSHYDEIIKVKKLTESTLKNDNEYSVILYHLDSATLSKYTPYEIESIYHHL